VPARLCDEEVPDCECCSSDPAMIGGDHLLLLQMDESGKLNKEHAVDMIKAMSKHDAEKEDAPAEVVDKCEAIEAPEDQ